MRTLTRWWLVLGAASALSFSAAADVIQPEVAACGSAKAGDACEVPPSDAVGSCQPSRCSKLDYSQGVPPQSVEVDCLTCVLGAPPAPEGAKTEPAKVDNQKTSACVVTPGADLGAGWLLLLGLGFWMRRRATT